MTPNPTRKSGECIAGVGHEREVRGAETITAGRESIRELVIAGANDFITELQRVLLDDLGQVVLECEVLADFLVLGQTLLAEEGFMRPVQLDWLLQAWKLGKVSGLTFGIPSCLAQSCPSVLG